MALFSPDLFDIMSHTFDLLDSTYLYFARQVCQVWRQAAVSYLQRDQNFRSRMICVLIRDDQLQLLQEVYGVIFEVSADLAVHAPEYGRLQIAEWFYQQNSSAFSFSASAISHPSPDTVIWMLRLRTSWSIEFSAGASGSIKVVEYILNSDLKCKFDLDWCYFGVVHSGSVELAKWLRQTLGLPECMEAADTYGYNYCEHAARLGHFRLLKWFIKNRFNPGRKVANEALVSGNIEMVKWLLNRGHQLHKLSKYLLRLPCDSAFWAFDRLDSTSVNLWHALSGGNDNFDSRVFDHVDQEIVRIPRCGWLIGKKQLRCPKYIAFLVERGLPYPKDQVLRSAPGQTHMDIIRLGLKLGQLEWLPRFCIDAAWQHDLDFLREAAAAGRVFPRITEFDRLKIPYIRRWVEWLLDTRATAASFAKVP
jgi:hypothetical protein